MTSALMQEISDKAITQSMAIFLTVLLDKEGYDKTGLQRVWREVNEPSDSITGRFVTVTDLIKVLDDEYDIVV
jgi:hypothetical protein